MATITGSGYARLSCRVSARVKRKVEQAAEITGQTVTEFTESAVAEKADAVIDKHERIVLSERDFTRFVQAIENPADPTPELRGAMSEYLALRAAHPDHNL